jgi:signal transduction histidine kinase
MSKILIVDDEPSARETIEALLLKEDYQLEFAKDGYEGLKIAEAVQPDLILLDVMMPGMNGFEVCRRIRATPTLAEVPIIMVTALDDRSSLLLGIEAGADDFLSKPIDRQELRLRVRTIIRLNRYRTLVKQRENLRAMAEHVIAAQEQERKRISRELHDDIGQALMAHMLNLRNLQIEASTNNKAIEQRLNELIADTQQTLNKMRLLAQDLRPPLLDTLDFKVAVQTFCQEAGARSGLTVTIDVDENLGEFSDVYTITLYRFLQETITNVIKHSKATQLWVELSRDENDITLTVQDNGIGFSEEGLPGNNGIGITGLNERLTIVGGELKISSSATKGTIISAHLPFPVSETIKDEAA